MTDNYNLNPTCEALVAIQTGEWDLARLIITKMSSADRRNMASTANMLASAANMLANMCLAINQSSESS